VGKEIVDSLEGIEEGRADDIADGLESGRGDGTRIWHNGEGVALSMPWRNRRRRRCRDRCRCRH
jgi:hypothetical protein